MGAAAIKRLPETGCPPAVARAYPIVADRQPAGAGDDTTDGQDGAGLGMLPFTCVHLRHLRIADARFQEGRASPHELPNGAVPREGAPGSERRRGL